MQRLASYRAWYLPPLSRENFSLYQLGFGYVEDRRKQMKFSPLT